MKVAFRKSFERDLKKIKDPSVLKRVKKVVRQAEEANNFQEMSKVKKLSGTDRFFRIRIGEHRIGISLADEELEFVRCLHRRDMYRYFP